MCLTLGTSVAELCHCGAGAVRDCLRFAHRLTESSFTPTKGSVATVKADGECSVLVIKQGGLRFEFAHGLLESSDC
jgi:hypothetical protein